MMTLVCHLVDSLSCMVNAMVIEVHDGILARSLREYWRRVVFWRRRLICCFGYVRIPLLAVGRGQHFANVAMDSAVAEWLESFATVV